MKSKTSPHDITSDRIGASTGLLLVDTAYRCVLTDPFAAALLGYTSEEMPHKNLVDLFGKPLFEAGLRDALVRCFQGEAVVLETLPVRHAAKSHPVRLTLRPLLQDGGQVAQAAIMVQEATVDNDAGEKVLADQRLEVERRRQSADGLRIILGLLNANRPLDEVLEYIFKQAELLLGADAIVGFSPVDSDAPTLGQHNLMFAHSIEASELLALVGGVARSCSRSAQRAACSGRRVKRSRSSPVSFVACDPVVA
ncbi:MAG: PAS domain-containing protein [Anaerolineales bacterium]|nr:PAS domain-containing protein [Anaerolineales bacterium]